MMQGFTFPDFKNPTALLNNDLSLPRFSERMFDCLSQMNASFEVAASEKTTWPEEIDFLQHHAEWHAQHSKMLADWARHCNNDHQLHLLREQINGYLVDVVKFLSDLNCMEVSDRHGSFDKSKWDWRVRAGCEWCAFAGAIDKSSRSLEEVTRAIDWRVRALLELNPEKILETHKSQLSALEIVKSEVEQLKTQQSQVENPFGLDLHLEFFKIRDIEEAAKKNGFIGNRNGLYHHLKKWRHGENWRGQGTERWELERGDLEEFLVWLKPRQHKNQTAHLLYKAKTAIHNKAPKVKNTLIQKPKSPRGWHL